MLISLPRSLSTGVAVTALITTSAVAQDWGDLPSRALNGLEGPSAGRNISNMSVANTPLAEEGLLQIAGYNLRTRSWTISAEDGTVPIHSHADRPAIVYTLSGEIFEYRSDTEGRISHGAGSLSLEEGNVTHWWLNEGSEDVRLIAFDVFNAGGDDMVDYETPDLQAFDLPEQSDAELELLGLVDIEAHYDGEQGDGLALSAYRAVLEPGGVLPSFVTAGEPLQVWVWQGEVAEYRSDNDDPVMLGAEVGDNVGGGVQAYWENTGDVPAELFFAVVEPLSETEGVEQTGLSSHTVSE